MMKIVSLDEIAYARSGDKGSASNVGIIFLNQNIYDWAVDNLTEEIIADYFKDIALGGVKRYLLPNISAMNFILFNSLDGGGSESLTNDAQGKTHGQALLKMKVKLPLKILDQNG